MESKKVELNGLNYHYLEGGNPQKPKLFIAHGVIVEANYLMGVIDRLIDDYYIYAIDLKGHGLSDNGESYEKDYAPEVVAKDFYEFYKKVIKEPFVFIGYSLGGQLGMAYSSLFPETLKAFVIIDSSPSVPLKGLFTLILADFFTPKTFETLENVKAFYDQSKEGLGEYMLKHCISKKEDGTYKLRFDKLNVNPITMSGYSKRNDYLWEAFGKITVPTFLLKAKDSQVIMQKMVRLMLKMKPEMEVVYIEGAGHDFVFTQPEEVTKALRNYFEKVLN